jgi:ubiquinone/menaquinone biosynthesis C-methylase UbiE
LPHEIADICFRQGLRINPDPDFNRDMDKLVEALPTLMPGEDGETTEVQDHWPLLRNARQHVLDLVVPAYILDSNYHFLDWNPAFEAIIAAPLGLQRGQHAVKFIGALKNLTDVVTRSKKVFKPGTVPLVDIEPLVFDSRTYGELHFQKVAVQVGDSTGNVDSWVVSLNVLKADQGGELWKDLQRILEESVNWSKYAQSYDRLLLSFPEYGELIEHVLSKIGAVASTAGETGRIADMGAGTGNGVVRLLERFPSSQVYAIESNYAMLELLRQKIRDTSLRKHLRYDTRFYIVKGDIGRQGFFSDEYFDAAVMINVLYSLSEPAETLKEISRVLKPGGVLALSTAHSGTNIDALFMRLKQRLEEQQLFPSLRGNYDDARRRHEQMRHLITRDSKAQIHEYLSQAGFDIVECEDDYVGAVIVIKAIRR